MTSCVYPRCDRPRESKQSGGYCRPHRRGHSVNGSAHPPILYSSPLTADIAALGMQDVLRAVIERKRSMATEDFNQLTKGDNE